MKMREVRRQTGKRQHLDEPLLANSEISYEDLMGKNNGKDTCILSLYTKPPRFDFGLEELYKCTNQRYVLLQLLSEIGDLDMVCRDSWIPALLQRMDSLQLREHRRIILQEYRDSFEEEYLRIWDTTGHYLMRTACARLYESLKWFINQEIKLFHIKWELINDNQRKYFLSESGLRLNTVCPDERIQLFTKYRDFKLLNDLYKSRFDRVSRLLKLHKAYLVRGWVYYKLEHAVYPIMTLYYEYLNSSLRKAKQIHNNQYFDRRYTFFFRRISEQIKTSTFKLEVESCGRVRINELDRLSRESFPLCMNVMHHHLVTDSHLRNGARFQYNLFLKGIGLSLHDSIKFWRDIFLRKMSMERFTAQYLYSIRHGYGKLGKQADYPPLSCSRIMDSTAGPLDHHGCPFKNPNMETLKKHLRRSRLNDEEVQQILAKVEENVPHQACARMFEITHSVSDQGATTHPNIYFVKSRSIREKRSVPVEKIGESCSKPIVASTNLPTTEQALKNHKDCSNTCNDGHNLPDAVSDKPCPHHKYLDW